MIDLINKITTLSRKDPRDVFVKNAKLMEEVGEFSEALLYNTGYLSHKTMKEPLEGEVADIIICIVDTLCGAYPDKSQSEIVDMIQHQLTLKTTKWEKLIK